MVWSATGAGAGGFADPRHPELGYRAIIAAAKSPPSLLPGVYNARDGIWNGPAADHVLTNRKARTKMLADLVAVIGADPASNALGLRLDRCSFHPISDYDDAVGQRRLGHGIVVGGQDRAHARDCPAAPSAAAPPPAASSVLRRPARRRRR